MVTAQMSVSSVHYILISVYLYLLYCVCSSSESVKTLNQSLSGNESILNGNYTHCVKDYTGKPNLFTA